MKRTAVCGCTFLPGDRTPWERCDALEALADAMADAFSQTGPYDQYATRVNEAYDAYQSHVEAGYASVTEGATDAA